MIKHRNKIIASVFVLLTSSILLIASIPPVAAEAQFVLAGWDFPDEYGQGISTWYAQSNATGSWVSIDSAGYLDVTRPPIPWNVSQAIRILIWSALNKTLVDVEGLEAGKNYIRHSVTVTNSLDAEVFTQQNLTHDYAMSDVDLYWYRMAVILDFSPLSGELYTVLLICEVYY